MSTDISVDTRPISRSTVGQYVDRYIGQGVHKIHMIRENDPFSQPRHELKCQNVEHLPFGILETTVEKLSDHDNNNNKNVY